MSNNKNDQYRLLERHEFVAQCRLRTPGSLARISIVRNLTSEGCAVECIPVSLQRAAMKAIETLLRTIRRDGTQQSLLDQMQTREELYNCLDYHSYEEKLDQQSKESKS